MNSLEELHQEYITVYIVDREIFIVDNFSPILYSNYIQSIFNVKIIRT